MWRFGVSSSAAAAAAEEDSCALSSDSSWHLLISKWMNGWMQPASSEADHKQPNHKSGFFFFFFILIMQISVIPAHTHISWRCFNQTRCQSNSSVNFNATRTKRGGRDVTAQSPPPPIPPLQHGKTHFTPAFSPQVVCVWTRRSRDGHLPAALSLSLSLSLSARIAIQAATRWWCRYLDVDFEGKGGLGGGGWRVGGGWVGFVPGMIFYSYTAANAVIFSLYSHWVALSARERCIILQLHTGCWFNRGDDLVCVIVHYTCSNMESQCPLSGPET